MIVGYVESLILAIYIHDSLHELPIDDLALCGSKQLLL